MKIEIEFKKGNSKNQEKNTPTPTQPINGSKPKRGVRKPECEKKHITNDGKRRKTT